MKRTLIDLIEILVLAILVKGAFDWHDILNERRKEI